jgi:predicted PurR-regulated permease PerM
MAETTTKEDFPGEAAPAPIETTVEETQRVLLHMPVDVRSVSLAVLATMAGVFMLHWASAICIPVMVGLVLSYALSPIVDWLQTRGLPRGLTAGLLILGIFGGMGSAAFALSDDASNLLELLPKAAQKLRDSLRAQPGQPDNPLTKMQKAATELEKAAADSTAAAPVARGVQRVQIEKPKIDVKDYLWSGSLGLIAMLGQVVTIALMAFFLMASGDSFRRKLVRIAGPTLSKKKVTLQALNEINGQIQRYLMIQLFTSIVVGVGTWLAFLALGLEHAAVWGISAGVFNLIPYFGSMVITAGSTLVAFLQFGVMDTALSVGVAAVVINSLEAFLLTPWLTSRANQMNPVAIFVGVLAWGWLWGIWGMLLGVPILVIIKAICDRVDDLKPVGEFLGE